MMIPNRIQIQPRIHWLAAIFGVANYCCVTSDAFSPALTPSLQLLHPLASRRLRSPPNIPLIVKKASSSSDVNNSSSSSRIDAENNVVKINNNSDGENDMKTLGEKIILQAALAAGATASMIDVEWKSDRIVVMVDASKDEAFALDNDDSIGEGGVWIGDSLDENLVEEGVDWEEDDGDIIYEEEFDEPTEDEDEFDNDEFALESNTPAIDLTLITRNINELLAQDGEDSLAYKIAVLHEIEVTTPIFDNVLRGPIMFENYKGFDVMVKHWEEPQKKKKKKKKTKAQKENAASNNQDKQEEVDVVVEPKLKITEGKLVGKDDEKGITTINVKGRLLKIKNDKIECVRLPNPKSEKGVK